MHRIRNIALLSALICVISAPASAAWVRFTATLNGANEAPPNGSLGTGFAVVDFDTLAHTMRVQVTFADLTTGNTAAHIHCCTTTPGTGTAGVATITPTFTGFPSGVTFGSYDHIYDLTAAVGTYNPAFITAQGSVAAAEAALFNGALQGRDYLNIHTTTVPGGEIRGFLVQAPEPMTLTLFCGGLVAAGVYRRRKNKAA